MPTLDRDGDVYLLHLGDDENRFTAAWLAVMLELVAEVAATQPPVALVTVAGGKFWSNGLDLDWLLSHPDDAAAYIADVQRLMSQLITLPVPTVAAIQGHCFAAGAMFALAHDWRTMRADRGFFCLPEVDLGIPFTVGMDTLIRSKLTPSAAIEAMTTGRQYGGSDAAIAGIVTAAVAEDQVVTSALEIARPLAGKASAALGVIKQRMFAEVARLLTQVDNLAP
jgi:enoyl-CoA hydratase/carnithine racemase